VAVQEQCCSYANVNQPELPKVIVVDITTIEVRNNVNSVFANDKYVTVAVDANEVWTVEFGAGETGIPRRRMVS